MQPSNPHIERPLVLITGASSGIGLALADRYYRAGYRLALIARRSQLIDDWAQKKGWDLSRIHSISADVSVIDSIVGACRDCLDRLGLPDVVIANAGISLGIDTSERVDLDVMALTFATNNLGMAATFHPFIAAMCQRGSGTLVGIGSVAGIRGLPGHGAYCASKAGVISYMESLRGEVRASGVKAVTICPGYIDTPLTRKNSYAMPFLMTPESFADRAFQAIESGASYRVIPWQMGWVAKLLRLLPNGIYDRLLSGRPRKHRITAD